jgi:predicted nuclease of predicted toxin-antitoxin system
MSGTPLRLMLDEYIWKELTKVLKERGYDALSIVDVSRSAADETILELASTQGRAVLTFNVRHFGPLAQIWYERGKNHARIILSEEISQTELIRRTIRFLEAVTAEDMENNVRRLEDFK